MTPTPNCLTTTKMVLNSGLRAYDARKMGPKTPAGIISLRTAARQRAHQPTDSARHENGEESANTKADIVVSVHAVASLRGAPFRLSSANAVPAPKPSVDGNGETNYQKAGRRTLHRCGNGSSARCFLQTRFLQPRHHRGLGGSPHQSLNGLRTLSSWRPRAAPQHLLQRDRHSSWLRLAFGHSGNPVHKGVQLGAMAMAVGISRRELLCPRRRSHNLILRGPSHANPAGGSVPMAATDGHQVGDNVLCRAMHVTVGEGSH